MAELVVVVPSRGRPQAVAELARAFNDTCTAYGPSGEYTKLLWVVDADDPALVDYQFAAQSSARGARCWANVDVLTQPGGTMVTALNFGAAFASKSKDVEAIAFMGDDHRPRTDGWDAAYLDALRAKPGLVYGNDLLQRSNLPTQVAMSADVVRALGHMAPPPLTHLYVDNYWRDLGQAADCITYLPDVVVEHLHPVAGKAAMDEGYVRVNAPEMYDKDAAAYQSYWLEYGSRDIEVVTSALSVATS